MKIATTDDLREQIILGRDIFVAQPAVYSPEVTNEIRRIIRTYRLPEGITDEDAFYISVYNYWRYGFVTKEVFYFDLFHKDHDQKETYMSNMNKLNYTRHLNLKDAEYMMADKYETYQILKEYYGREIIYVSAESGYDQFREFFRNHSEFVVKPVGLATSIGVKKCFALSYHNDPELALRSLLEETEEIQSHYRWSYGKGIIVEEVIRQGDALSRLHPASVNSVRITTVVTEDGVHFFYPVLRVGKSGEFLCSRSSGSIVAGINAVSGLVETDGFTDENEHYVFHPDTGFRFKGFPVPKWKELSGLAVKLALKFEDLHYIGWDFAYTDCGEWIVIEGNENAGFVGQIPYQRGLLREFTDLIHWKSDKEYWWTGRYSL